MTEINLALGPYFPTFITEFNEFYLLINYFMPIHALIIQIIAIILMILATVFSRRYSSLLGSWVLIFWILFLCWLISYRLPSKLTSIGSDINEFWYQYKREENFLDPPRGLRVDGIRSQINKRNSVVLEIVQIAKSYAIDEDNLLDNVAEAISIFTIATTDADVRIDLYEEIVVENNIVQSLKPLSLLNAYTELKNDQQFNSLWTEYQGIVSRLNYDKAAINLKIIEFNSIASSFPHNWLIRIHKTILSLWYVKPLILYPLVELNVP